MHFTNSLISNILPFRRRYKYGDDLRVGQQCVRSPRDQVAVEVRGGLLKRDGSTVAHVRREEIQVPEKYCTDIKIENKLKIKYADLGNSTNLFSPGS